MTTHAGSAGTAGHGFRAPTPRPDAQEAADPTEPGRRRAATATKETK